MRRDLRRAWRWLFNAKCSEPFCDQRRICWRWHVETFTCPTCKHEVTEFDPAVMAVIDATFVAVGDTEPRTWSAGTNTMQVTHRSWSA